MFTLIKNGDLEALKKVQESMPADQFLSMRNPQGQTTMMLFAANEGHTDIVEYLLALKADINEVSRVSPNFLTLVAMGNCTFTRGIFQQN